MMDLMALATAAANIAAWTANKTVSGALSKAGGELLAFLKEHLSGKIDFSKINGDKKPLEAAILSQAHLDEEFKSSIEKFVTNYQKAELSGNSVSQNSASEANINIGGDNSGNVVGQQNIGSQTYNSFFRPGV